MLDYHIIKLPCEIHEKESALIQHTNVTTVRTKRGDISLGS